LNKNGIGQYLNRGAVPERGAYALASKSPATVVAVVVKRNGVDLKVDMMLEARR
jgi:hypothetical protein